MKVMGLKGFFSSLELRLLELELQKSIDQSRAVLQKPEVEGKKRENLEKKLITSLSILRKVEQLLSAQKKDKTPKPTARALVVDDVESMCRMNAQLLQVIGFKTVDAATDGLQALQMMRDAYFEEKPYTLVLSDWEMPNLSGMDLLMQVRLDEDLWRVPFFLLTGIDSKAHIMKAINAGADGYFVKPVCETLLEEKLAEYL